MKTEIVLKCLFAIISAIVGGVFGNVGVCSREIVIVSSVIGVISGLIVGYFYVCYMFQLKSPSVSTRISSGIFYGTSAGLITGILVSIPSFYVRDCAAFFVLFGRVIGGSIVGVILGLIGIIFIPMKIKSE